MADSSTALTPSFKAKDIVATMKKDVLQRLNQDLEKAVGPAEKEKIILAAITDDMAVKLAAATKVKEEDIDAANKAAGVLGELILRMNPYTNSQVKDGSRSTGEMEIIGAEAVETEGPYAQEWTFKGHPQRVGMAARIKYRYPVRNERSETLFWVEDYLLIGFQGSMGG